MTSTGWRHGAGNGRWLLDRVQQAFWQVAVGRQFVTISRIFQNLPHVCRHLIQGALQRFPTRKYESLVPICGWVDKKIYTSPHRASLSKIHFLHWYIQGWSEKRGGRKGCELRIVGKIYSLARGHRHRHETSDWTGRDTNTALHNPTVGRQHTQHTQRDSFTFPGLCLTLFWGATCCEGSENSWHCFVGEAVSTWQYSRGCALRPVT